jgi:hypothetical protein
MKTSAAAYAWARFAGCVEGLDDAHASSEGGACEEVARRTLFRQFACTALLLLTVSFALCSKMDLGAKIFKSRRLSGLRCDRCCDHPACE